MSPSRTVGRQRRHRIGRGLAGAGLGHQRQIAGDGGSDAQSCGRGRKPGTAAASGPGARQDAIGKVEGDQIKVSVTAAPVAGRATDHMVRFLAGEFGVTSSDIQVVFGRFNVNKQLRIKSPGMRPQARLNRGIPSA
jgi:uncharacterized protein YggU (UPF0235/DUF167 family)